MSAQFEGGGGFVVGPLAAYLGWGMVLILDGNSDLGAHIRSNHVISFV